MRFYYRPTGAALPGKPGSREFMAAYQTASRDAGPALTVVQKAVKRRTHGKGSIDWLVDANPLLEEARELGEAWTLFLVLCWVTVTHFFAEITSPLKSWPMSFLLWRTNRTPRCGSQSDYYIEAGPLARD
jgi:hypothetical protein